MSAYLSLLFLILWSSLAQAEDNFVIDEADQDLEAIVASIETLQANFCLLYTSPSPRDRQKSRMPSSA